MSGRFIITGASSGIGAAAVRRCLERGDLVAGLDLDPTALPPHPGLLPLAADVSDAAAVRDAVAAAVEHWDAAPTAVVHCAGVYRVAPAEEVEPAAWDLQFAINVRGSFLVAQAAACSMIEHGTPGSIVLLSSVAYDRGDESEPSSAYAAGKGAVVSLTRQLAVEWGARGIRVNAIAPGVIDTPMTVVTQDPEATRALVGRLPLRRLGTADEVAAACLFLAGPEAAYITGATLHVDGGYLAS